MKITIVKYLNPKGKVVEMKKNIIQGKYLPADIIEGYEEYEVEIKGEDSNETDWLEDLKRKYESGNYILITPRYDSSWIEVKKPLWNCDNYVLIHIKHKDILERYLKNPSVEIETGMFAPMTGETEPSKWVDLEKDFIEDYNEEFWYRLKVKDLAWYEEKDNFRIVVKQIKSLNDYTEKDGEIFIMEKITDNNGISFYNINRSHTPLLWLECYRPATESEALSLVYKPQQKVSKEEILAESNRLMYLFLDDKAECLVENEQEFRLVYDFLDKACDKNLNMKLSADGNFKYSVYNDEFPIILTTPRNWGNIYEWNRLEDRDFSKPLIKFDGETFWEVIE